MQLLERAKAGLQLIQETDFSKYLDPEEHARVIPAETLAEEVKRRMLLGKERETGLTLPWMKANDKVLIRPGKLIVWCGWSYHGKSQVLKHLMVEAISQGERVCMASMEEEVREIWEEMGYLAMATRYPSPRDIDQWVNLFAGKLWFYDQQGRVKPEKLKAVIRYAAKELKVNHFVIDSLMMIGVSRDDYELQGQFIADMKAIGEDTGCTIHLVCHMRKTDSRGGEDQPGSVHDIAGPHQISSIADSIFNVWRDKNKKTEWPAVLKVEKQRGSVNWIGSLGLGYDTACRQYTNEVGGSVKNYCGSNEKPF
jgi:twinkle protein